MKKSLIIIITLFLMNNCTLLSIRHIKHTNCSRNEMIMPTDGSRIEGRNKEEALKKNKKRRKNFEKEQRRINKKTLLKE